MRTKLFAAFLLIIAAALLSTVLFAWLILNDFDDYAQGVRQDHVYWVRLSVEGAYRAGEWNRAQLAEAIHWAMMMGLEVRVLDAKGNQVVLSHDVLEGLPESMKKHMEELFHVNGDSSSVFENHMLGPLKRPIGTLLVRPFPKKELAEKEAAFKTRTRYFLLISLAIAGIGALVIGLFLSQSLSKPLRRLRSASEKIASGDFSVRVPTAPADEVGDLAKAFNRMSESLQREEQLRRHLLSNIAHELRTPLSIMKARAEAMADGLLPDTAKGLEGLIAEVDRLTVLIKGIEDVTAAEASFFKPGQMTELNLTDFLTELGNARLPDFQAKGLTLTIAAHTPLPVTTDAEKLERIVVNLLSNALKFTPSGSVSLDFGTDGEEFFIGVSDTGRGIPADQLPHVFTRFYRADSSAADGLGLGLSIVKELVEVMSGRVEIISTFGEGTTVTVFLPLKQ